MEELETESQQPAEPAEGAGTLPTPVEIAEALGRRVIGQEKAIREMSIALAKYLAGAATGNILMIGASGTGKTTLMRAVEGYLDERPQLARRSTVIRVHANVLGEEARQGRPGQAIIGRLLEEARRELGPEVAEAEPQRALDRAARGLVFIDEVDKIRSQVGDRPNVEGIRAQEALLTLIENEAVPFELPRWAGGGAIRFDSSEMLFVCAGAFEGLYQSVYDRVTIGRDKGALQPTTVVEGGQVRQRVVFRLRDWLKNEDLFDYGMTPQFLSRFDAVVLLEDLGVDNLTKIFLDSPESGLQQSRAYFASRDVRLTLSPDAVRRIAEEAARQPRLGARALKEVFRRVIREYEYDPEGAGATMGEALLIDVEQVDEALE
jgi:ATP-dependent Clp protease ATP-binding subunit ClpX